MKSFPEALRRLSLWAATALPALGAVPSPAPAAQHAVILQYHHFGDDTPPSTSVTPAQFTAHLDYLAEMGFTVWPVAKIVARAREGGEFPERCVGITVDDAYTSVYERAFPLLKARALPFTVFVATEGVDRGYGDYLSWDQMREMGDFGADFASHSHSHDYLIRRRPRETEGQWAARMRQEIDLSRRRLREELGKDPELFAYPYGEYDLALRAIVTDAGLVAFGQQSGAVWAGSDFGALPRFPMAAGYADTAVFGDKVGSLPLPVLSAEPAEPVLPPDVSSPVLRLRIAPGDYRRASLACFSGGGERLTVRWSDGEGVILEVTSAKPMPEGRSRYTCTAPHREGKRYFWYSHLWIRPGGE